MINKISDNITFQSKIKFVDHPSFREKVATFGRQNYVDFPWTIKESVMSDKVYTRGIAVCTSCVLTDGIKALMLHICPTFDAIKNFQAIENYIRERFGWDCSKLKGFLIGAIDEERSLKLHEKFEKFLNKENIPYSQFKCGDTTVSDVAYSVKDDEFLISSVLLDDKNRCKELKTKNMANVLYRDHHICELDELV